MTPTTGHQFDVPPVNVAHLVAGLAANCDPLRLVESHLAPHLAGFTRRAVAHILPNVQNLRLRYQRLPHLRLVAGPAEETPENKQVDVARAAPAERKAKAGAVNLKVK